jgi:hypothetical protein
MLTFGGDLVVQVLALVHRINAHYPVVGEIINLMEYLVENMPWHRGDLKKLARDQWIKLLCTGTTTLQLAHLHRSFMPDTTTDMTMRAMAVLKLIKQRIKGGGKGEDK